MLRVEKTSAKATAAAGKKELPNLCQRRFQELYTEGMGDLYKHAKMLIKAYEPMTNTKKKDNEMIKRLPEQHAGE